MSSNHNFNAESEFFLGRHFTPLRLEHRDVIQPVFEKYPLPLAGFTFSSLACWNSTYHYGFHISEDKKQLLIRCSIGDQRPWMLLQPIGEIGDREALELLELGSQQAVPIRFLGCGREFLESHPLTASACDIDERRDMANYIYTADSLARLQGRRLSKKRNLIAQARRSYSWTVADLRERDMPECLELTARIADEDHPLGRDSSWLNEMQALRFCIENYGLLGQSGTAIRIDGKLAAFSIWEPTGPEMAVVHFERALRRFKGLYQVVNLETALRIEAEGFTLINREEDAGETGLRQAKLSYFPLRLQPSLTLCLRS